MEKVTAGYGERIVLDAIKLNLVPGSRIGLLGRNGVGKSPLIKLLAQADAAPKQDNGNSAQARKDSEAPRR